MLDRNAEFPSCFELWDFVVSFEDGSLPSSAWNEQSLAVIATWYLFLLSPSEAIARLELGLRRNEVRFAKGSGVDSGLKAADIWPRIMRHVLAAMGQDDPLSVANRLMMSSDDEARDRAA